MKTKDKDKKTTLRTTHAISTEQLKELGDYGNETKNKRFKRLEERLLTYEFLDSIPQALKDLRFEDVKAYLHYSGVFLSVYDRHKAYEKRFALEEQRLNLLQKKNEVNTSSDNADNSSSSELIESLFS